jgi:hypothetical protein
MTLPAFDPHFYDHETERDRAWLASPEYAAMCARLDAAEADYDRADPYPRGYRERDSFRDDWSKVLR